MLDDYRRLCPLGHRLTTLARNMEQRENEAITCGCVVCVPIVPVNRSLHIEVFVWTVREEEFTAL